MVKLESQILHQLAASEGEAILEDDILIEVLDES